MGDNNLQLRFVLGKDKLVRKLEDLELDKLLAAVAGDIYSQRQIAEMSRRILSSTFQGVRGGSVEVQIGKLYWFSIGAYEEKETYVSIGVDETFFYRYDEGAEQVVADFAKRAMKAFEAMKPWYGYAETYGIIGGLRESYGADVKPLTHVCWLNYYSPELAAGLGRGRILSAARETAQELGDVTIDEFADGAIMLQVGKLPDYVYNIPKVKALEKELFGNPCKYDAKRA